MWVQSAITVFWDLSDAVQVLVAAAVHVTKYLPPELLLARDALPRPLDLRLDLASRPSGLRLLQELVVLT